MPKISVIMPMYNVEKYVALAIHSLLNQTFKDFEAIFIDDCSNDRTFEIAKSFDDPRIKIIQNEKNLGCGLSRNVGIDLARGDYIYFLDSDDYLLENAFEILIGIAENTQADVVQTNSFFNPSNESFKTLKGEKFHLKKLGNLSAVSNDLRTRLIQEYCQKDTIAFLWLKLYKTQLLKENDIKFVNFKSGSDHIFLIDVLCATSNIIKIDKPFYVYRVRNTSVSHNKTFNFEELPLRLDELFRVPLLCEKSIMKSLNLQAKSKDYFLIATVSRMLMKMLIEGIHILPYYNKSPDKTLEIINLELEKKFDKKSNLILSMFYGFIQESFTAQTMKNVLNENKQLKLRMKTVKENVNKLIPF